MSYRPIQKKQRRIKPFSLNKCFHLSGLTRSLFPCGSNRNTENVNYEYLEYCLPATSTMIESPQFNNERNDTTETSRNLIYNPNCDNYTFQLQESEPTSSGCSFISEISPSSSTMLLNQGNYVTLESNEMSNDCIIPQHRINNTEYDCLYELEEEETCKTGHGDESVSYSVSNQYEDITIRRNNSPISTFYNYEENTVVYGCECLHSTEMSGVHSSSCVQCNMPRYLSPMSSSSSSSCNQSGSFLTSPVSTSTSFTFEQHSTIESILSGLELTLRENSNNETHVCASDYEATFVNDVTVHFADTIKIIRDNNDEWLYVQVASDGRQGYVPRTIVMDLKQFVEQLVKNKASMIQHLLD